MSDTAPHSIGLTGSIGMGKSTVAGFFADAGVAVWDADEAVHRLYDVGGAGVEAISGIAPEAIVAGRVDRARLSKAIRANSLLLKQVEAVIHPLVALDRSRFRKDADASFVLFDIPLLFEGGMSDQFDTIVVVSAPLDVQRARVLGRDNMDAEKFEFILSKQMPDDHKRERADFVIETAGSFEDTRDQVNQILEKLRSL